MIDEDLPDFVKKLQRSHINFHQQSCAFLLNVTHFFSQIFKLSDFDSMHSGTKTTGSRAIVSSFSFCHSFSFLRQGYVHGVTFSRINLDVLEARFTCIEAPVVYYNAAEAAEAVTHSFLFRSASAYSAKHPPPCT